MDGFVTHVWPLGEGLDPGSSVASRDIQISILHRDPRESQQHASLLQPSSAAEVEEGLFSQLTSGMEDEVVSGPPVVLNPNKAILTVDHETREVLGVKAKSPGLDFVVGYIKSGLIVVKLRGRIV